MKRMTALLALAIALLLTAVAPAGAAVARDATFLPPAGTVELQILSVSDWHAQLDPLNGVGGAAALSTYFKAERAANPNTLTFTAGDAYGASPPLSGFFGEEPAVKAMNLMGFTADTFGNHNFDRGIAGLQPLIDLAEFDYVSSNLANVEDELDGVVSPYAVYETGGIRVGVVGITNPEAPTLVFPGNFGSIQPIDPVAAARRAVARARLAGAQVLIAIAHLGATGVDPATGRPTGPLIDFAQQVRGFDLILGDHTDMQVSTRIGSALVVENRSKGVTYARTTLEVARLGGDVVSASNEFVTPLASAVVPDPAIVSMLAPYRAALAAVFDQKIGKATGEFPRGGNIERLREVAIGNLVADSMRVRYGTQIAFTNGGGIRAALPSSYVPAAGGLVRSGCSAATPCDILIGDVFTVLPFGNTVVTRTITGALLYSVLEKSVEAIPAANGRFLQISGFRYRYDSSRPAGSRVVDVTLADGTPIARDGTTYTLATNDFVNAGGDGYTMLADGQGTSREVMADVLVEYIRSLGTITPRIENRIVNLAS